MSTEDDALIAAAKAGDAVKVKDLIEAGEADVNYAEPRTGLTALHYAAGYDAIAVLKVLIRVPELDFTVKDAQGRTPSMLAYTVARNRVVGRYLIGKQHPRLKRAVRDKPEDQQVILIPSDIEVVITGRYDAEKFIASTLPELWISFSAEDEGQRTVRIRATSQAYEPRLLQFVSMASGYPGVKMLRLTVLDQAFELVDPSTRTTEERRTFLNQAVRVATRRAGQKRDDDQNS